MSVSDKKISLSQTIKFLVLIVIAFVCLAPGRYDDVVLGWFSAFKTTPAQKCADARVVDLLTSNIRETTARTEKLLSDKPSNPYGSNGSYAKPAANNEAKINVVVRRILATDYDPKIDRVRCQITYVIEGAERSNFLVLLEGKNPERTSTYFVQPDENNRPVVSW